VLIGTWGDINLTTDSSGGAIALTCVEGDFPPLRVDGQGRFDVSGTYIWRPGNPQPTYPVVTPARFQGQVIGPTLVLTMTVFHSTPVTGTYHLMFISVKPTYSPPSPCA
jgi:hypothetical protein